MRKFNIRVTTPNCTSIYKDVINLFVQRGTTYLVINHDNYSHTIQGEWGLEILGDAKTSRRKKRKPLNAQTEAGR